MAIAMRKVVISYFMSVLLSSSLVYSLSLCNNTLKYLEVKEGKSDNSFTCTGLTAQETVRWIFDNGISQKMCSSSMSSTSFSCSTQVKAYRTSDTESIIIINANETSHPSYFGTATLTCQASTTSISCQLDLVYPAENSSCQVEFQNNKVTALCSVSKVRSARNNYHCSLYQALEASQGRFVGSYDMEVLQKPSGYFSGTCNMSSYLPPEGRYSYYVIIMPGEVNVSAAFIGKNIISRPRGTLYHHCPLYLNEGDSLSCLCFVSDFGSPPGILRWNNTNSNRLELRNLQKSQNGIQSVCSLTWNNTVHQSVTYTPIVAYRPTWVNFTMNSKESQNVSVVKNSYITMRCEADGRPAPRMTISKISNNSILNTMPGGNITVGDQRGAVIYTVAMAQTSDSDTYRCTAANRVGMKEQSINLIVECPPRGTLYHNCPMYLNEGDNLNCLCFASDPGNPPGILRWNNTNSNRLEIRNLQKSQNGIQSVCSLTWNNTVHHSVSYTPIVAYQPTWMSFTMNNEKSEDVFVDEQSPVILKCQADGRPVPRMTFTKVRDNSFLKTVPMGHIIVEDQRAEIIHTLAGVQCSDTDRYRCTAANSLGMKEQFVSLSVKCKPRRADANPRTPIILEGKTSSFELIAYPNSVKVTKYFIGSNNNNNELLASDDIFRVDCTSNCQQLHKVTCTVTVIKVTVNTAGLYKAVVSNDLGSVALIFEALPLNTTDSEKSELNHKAGLGTGLGVGLGLAAAEAVVFTTVVLVLWWRRNHHTPKAKRGRENTRYSLRQDILLDKAVELTVSAGWEHESTYENVGKGEPGQTAIYTNVEISNLTSKKTSNNTGKLYENLHLKDVGASSPYDSLTTLNIAKPYH